MKILFHSNQLGIRGTEVALYDYAHYNETTLGNISYIAAPANSDMSTLSKFKNRFNDRVLLYEDFNSLKDISVDCAYFIKAGFNDGKLIPGVKNIVHYVFNGVDPHGDVYVGVSEWLGKKYNTDYLPHIVSLPEVEENYRRYFQYSNDDIVFGRYGGEDQFDLPYLKMVVEASANVGIKFLFMNTRVFTSNHPNIIYLNSAYEEVIKRAFINTCDAMIHGRSDGESFGLSIAEFLFCNKPVVTNIEARDRNHITMLKDKGYYYSSPDELFAILSNFQKKEYSVKNLVEDFSPEKVMSKFNTIIQ